MSAFGERSIDLLTGRSVATTVIAPMVLVTQPLPKRAFTCEICDAVFTGCRYVGLNSSNCVCMPCATTLERKDPWWLPLARWLVRL